jgi:hypothetical protein
LTIWNKNFIFDKLASLANLKRHESKPEIIDHEKRFDNDWRNLRKSLRNISNQKHRDPDNKNIRLRYVETLKQYKHTLRTKKEQHIRSLLAVTEESIESNHFWENWNKVNKPSRGIGYPKWGFVEKSLCKPLQ